MPEADRATRSILLIEDDPDLCCLMQDYFREKGFRIESAQDGRQGLARSMEGDFDLIILDVMLPTLDGFEVLRQLRKRSETPVIMLTARTAEVDRVTGLNSGADDYLPKPFGPEELLARIRAVLRRVGKADAAPQIIEAGGVKLNPQSRQAWREDEPLELTALEFDILEILVRGAGRTVSRDELTGALHQRPSTPYERSLDVHISHLRKKLESRGLDLIRTIRGVGYQFATGAEAES
ncbi:MAG TPA: response regulator transcription factor [Bryobacteraceae bacterium]|jgi:two-component system response regulator CpxR|nr:response regulator transcription factor [Bryobacteraceae bacterium]